MAQCALTHCEDEDVMGQKTVKILDRRTKDISSAVGVRCEPDTWREIKVSPSTSRPHSYLRLLGGGDDAAAPYVGQTECPGCAQGGLVKCRDDHRELISLLNAPGDRRTIADQTTAINAYDSLFILFFHHKPCYPKYRF